MKQKLRSLVRKIFLRAEGGLCPAWRAALGILLTLAAYSAVLYGLASLFGALFDAWGLTTANLTLCARRERRPFECPRRSFLRKKFSVGQPCLFAPRRNFPSG